MLIDIAVADPFELVTDTSLGSPDCDTDELPVIDEAIAQQVEQNVFKYTCR